MSGDSTFTYEPHPHVEQRQASGPPTIAKARKKLHGDSRMAKINGKIGLRITLVVGTMWAAYVFALLALVSLPAILDLTGWIGHPFPKWMLNAGMIALVAWIAQTFLQLILLPIIIVGQNIQAAASDGRAQATFDDASAVLEEAKQIQQHLLAQDQAIQSILAKLAKAE
jgi:hypothetical protein